VQTNRPPEQVWICSGISKPYRVTSDVRDYGEFHALIDAERLRDLLLAGNEHMHPYTITVAGEGLPAAAVSVPLQLDQLRRDREELREAVEAFANRIEAVTRAVLRGEGEAS
jgi:hypothetical protein